MDKYNRAERRRLVKEVKQLKQDADRLEQDINVLKHSEDTKFKRLAQDNQHLLDVIDQVIAECLNMIDSMDKRY